MYRFSVRRMCFLLYTQFKIRILQFKTSNMATTPRQPASLFTIPAELRNEIYNYVAIQHEPIKPGLPSRPKILPVGLTSQPPPLASVSKQLRAEVLKIYYSKNSFVLGDDTCQIDPCLCSGNVNRWRPYLGQHDRDLRDVKMITANFYRQTNPAYDAFPKRGGHIST